MNQEICRIYTQGGGKAIQLVLTSSKVIMKFSDELMSSFKEDSDEARQEANDEGLLGKFGGFILGSIKKLMSQTIEYQLDEIKGIRNENGKIRFEYEKKHLLKFEFAPLIGNKRAHEWFDSDDINLFIEKFTEAREKYLKLTKS